VLWYVLIYYWAARGFSSEEIGLMGGIGSSVGVITYLFGGYLADVFGRKKLFLAGILSTATGLLLFLTEKNITVFTVAYGLTSLGGSLQWPSLTSLLAAKASPANMKYLYGFQGFVNQIGLTIATFLGIFGPPFLERTYDTVLTTGFMYVFLATAICAFVPILFVYRVTESKREAEKLSLHFDKRTKSILFMYCFQNALIGAGAGLVIPWFPVIFKEGLGASDSWVAGIITLSNAVIAIGWFIVPKFADFKGSVTLITACQIASCVPMILIPYSPVLWVIALLYTARSFLMLVPTPVLNAYMMNICKEKIRASFLSLSQLAWQLAFAGSYAVAGYLWANDYSKVGPFYYAVAFYIAASLTFFAYFRGVKENNSAQVDERVAG
jgi:MFS family permease